MRLAEVIGQVTLSRCHPNLNGGTWVLAVPLSHDGLQGETADRGEAIVVYDELGSSEGARIAISQGPEASAPFYPEKKPIDAYNAAILDEIIVTKNLS